MKLLDTKIDITLNTSGQAALEISYKGDAWYTVPLSGKWDQMPKTNEYTVLTTLECTVKKFENPFMTAMEAEAVALCRAVIARAPLEPAKPALYKIMGHQVYCRCPITWANNNKNTIREFLNSLVPDDCHAGYMGLSQHVSHPLYSHVLLVRDDGAYRAQPHHSRDCYDVKTYQEEIEEKIFNIIPAPNSGAALESACSRLESGEYFISCMVHNGSLLREEEVTVYV